MPNQYRANGKLLLTSEYMILHGARALALPLNRGQLLNLTEKEEKNILHWSARYSYTTWFETQIGLPGFNIISSTDREKSEFLIFMFQKAIEINAGFLSSLESANVITELEFDPQWGFGSSSTLTHLIARWASIDPMQLHFRISRGSGYDVACAGSEHPVIYEIIGDMPVIENVEYDPPFIDQLWLIYLGKKQRSDQSIATFFNQYKPEGKDIQQFSRLTFDFLNARSLAELGEVVTEHEQLLSGILDTPTVKESHFPTFPGFVKSLGAWGGDFVLAGSDLPADQLIKTMKELGYTTIFRIKDLMYNEK